MITNFANTVIKNVEQVYDLLPGTLIINKRRYTMLAEARQIAMYLISKHPRYSSTMIGNIFSKDHSTVLHNCKKIEKIVQEGSNQRIIDIIINLSK